MSIRLLSAAAGAVGLLALGTSWHATIKPVGSSGVSGSADVEPAMAAAQRDSSSYRASITILGAKPGAKHAWHVHSGRCGSGGGVVGSPSSYKPITVDQMGGGSSSAMVRVALDAGGDYHVNVHAAGGNEVIACGDLTTNGGGH